MKKYSSVGFDPEEMILALHSNIETTRSNGQSIVLFGTSFGSRIILDYFAHYGDFEELDIIWMNGFLPSFHESLRGKPPSQSRPASSTASPQKKIGCNDPCHCGSGKKYKKCHYPN